MKTRQLIALLTFACAAVSAQAADIVVIGNPSATPLSKEEVADIFLGKNQSRTPVDLPDGSPVYAEFYKKATGRDVSQVKSIWTRLVFGGKAEAPKQLPDAGAVKKAVAANPNAVGYIEKSAVDSSVKVLHAVE